jgi:ubiquinone/menaquinone biosynthesis C-methylase UbiE
MLQHLGDLTEKRVGDVGCGKGRFARIVRDQYPSASVLALDVAEAMLACVPPGIHRCAATMTALPLATASCDGAYAIESLEHAIDISSGVAELCRIVKSGGRVMIIDKNVEAWGRLKTPPWGAGSIAASWNICLPAIVAKFPVNLFLTGKISNRMACFSRGWL